MSKSDSTTVQHEDVRQSARSSRAVKSTEPLKVKDGHGTFVAASLADGRAASDPVVETTTEAGNKFVIGRLISRLVSSETEVRAEQKDRDT